VTGALVAGLTLGGLGIATASSRASQQTTGTSYPGSMMEGASPIATLSRLTGLSVQQIMALRNQGKSLATIATDNGIDPATLVDETLAARQAHFDALVAAGHMTAEQEQTVLDRMRAAIQAMIDAVPGPVGPPSRDTTRTPMVPGTGMSGRGHNGPHHGTGRTTPSAHRQHMGNTGSGNTMMTPGTPGQGNPDGSAPAGPSTSTGPGTGPGSGTGTMGPGSGMGRGSGMGSGSGMMGSRAGRP
jgi:hypothetical protein